MPPHIRLVTRHALLTYARKHWPAWQMRFLSGVVRAEAWVRQGAAGLKGDAATAAIFGELGRIASDLGGGRPAEALRRLLRVVWRQEEQRAGAPVGGHPQS